MGDSSWWEAVIRLGIFSGVFIIMALWEVVSPRRKLSESKGRRWLINLGLTFINFLFARVTVGALAFSVAVFARQNGWGLFNYFEVPAWMAIVVSFVVLDFSIYLQHVIVHAVPLFWRLHRLHHTDLNIDVTTGLRFHPLEILLSLLYKAAVIIVIGAPLWTVVAFEVILNAASQFNHGNVNIPKNIDRWLRTMIVTPDMHRIHHSTVVDKTNSNFGFSVSWWDRLCGTYKKEPAQSQLTMDIGLKEFRNQKELGLLSLIALPFRGKMGQYSYQKERVDS